MDPIKKKVVTAMAKKNRTRKRNYKHHQRGGRNTSLERDFYRFFIDNPRFLADSNKSTVRKKLDEMLGVLTEKNAARDEKIECLFLNNLFKRNPKVLRATTLEGKLQAILDMEPTKREQCLNDRGAGFFGTLKNWFGYG